MRNPNWVRDEIILALDLYFGAGRKQLTKAHHEVMRLSELLNRLPFHAPIVRTGTFRNPNGITMILGNFLGLDPAHSGPGLRRNNRLQQEVWDDFAHEPNALARTAEAIAAELVRDPPSSHSNWEDDDNFAFPEGHLLTQLHTSRERNRAAVERKIQRVLRKTGRLACEVCSFDFAETYGAIGRDFAECHHTLPLAELPYVRRTRLLDLAVVCANCHRMLHRARPVVSVEELRSVVQARREPTR